MSEHRRLDEDIFHYCRNRLCRSKLLQPAEIRHLAFCSQGCFVRYYRYHCLVCNKETREAKSPDARSPTHNFCSRKCHNTFRRYPHIFAGPGQAKTPGRHRSAESVKTGHGSACGTGTQTARVRASYPRNLLGGYRWPDVIPLSRKQLTAILTTELSPLTRISPQEPCCDDAPGLADPDEVESEAMTPPQLITTEAS